MKKILRWLALPAAILAAAAGWIAWMEYGADSGPEADRLVKELELGGGFRLACDPPGSGRCGDWARTPTSSTARAARRCS